MVLINSFPDFFEGFLKFIFELCIATLWHHNVQHSVVRKVDGQKKIKNGWNKLNK